MKKYQKPKIDILEIKINDKILNTSSNDNILDKDDIIEDDPSFGWGDLFS